ncbi:transcription repressor OFP4-like [Hibiscus syriacus]|nr:transcription repressor OFP4-like [Hibiscus syriacus]
MQNTSKIDKADERAIALASSSRLEETKSRASLIRKEPRSSPLARKSFRTSPGIKLRPNSPKISSKKIQSYAQKSQSPTCFKSWNRSIVESFAVVKSSLDPQRDFKDSMIEMIVENNIRSSKELEHLLACYLSLNSNKYSDLIIKAFEQIWVDMTNPCL